MRANAYRPEPQTSATWCSCTSTPRWGQGLASEAASALVEAWRAEFTQPTLVGLVEEGNAASGKVLLKAGLRYERNAEFRGARVRVFREDRP